MFPAAVRREYLRARARKHRWTEEVALLREEMRRVLRFLQWRSEWWRLRVTAWEGLDPLVAEGLRAYGFRQAALHDQIAAVFQGHWSTEGVKIAREAAEHDLDLGDSFIV